MLAENLAREVAASGRVAETSSEQCLARVAHVATRSVPGCAGATLTVTGAGLSFATATHEELGRLLDEQLALAEGPILDTAHNVDLVFIADTMDECRWPRFCERAVLYGVRSMLVLPLVTSNRHTAGTDPLAGGFALHGARPRAFSRQDATQIAALLAEELAVALDNTETVNNAKRDAAHWQRALASRAEIEQVKGMIMQALGCDAEAAFEELRQASNKSQRKLADLASELVTEHQSRSQPASR